MPGISEKKKLYSLDYLKFTILFMVLPRKEWAELWENESKMASIIVLTLLIISFLRVNFLNF